MIKKTLIGLSLISALGCNSEIGAGLDGPDAGAPPVSDPPQVCDEAVTITFEQRTAVPDILLVVDKSGSMGDPLVNGNVTSKWDVMRSAVANIVSNKGDKVNFGLMLFPWTNNCNDGQVRVTPGLNNVGPILQEMNSVGPGGSTPTHQSIKRARDYYDGQPVNPDGRIVLLATDGYPYCSTVNQSVTAIQELAQRNIQTYVLGFGFGSADINGLTQMAVAGTTGQVYSADSPDQLSFTLDSILGEVTTPSCNFELQETAEDDADINISVNGVELVRDDPNGWSFDSTTNTVTLLGASCEAVKAGGADGIAVDLGCEGAIVD